MKSKTLKSRTVHSHNVVANAKKQGDEKILGK
jgi:hypothetical protein